MTGPGDIYGPGNVDLYPPRVVPNTAPGSSSNPLGYDKIERLLGESPSESLLFRVESDIIPRTNSSKVTPVPIPKYGGLSQRPEIQSLQRDWESRQGGVGPGGSGEGRDELGYSERDEENGVDRILGSLAGTETPRLKMNGLKRSAQARDGTGMAKRRMLDDAWRATLRQIAQVDGSADSPQSAAAAEESEENLFGGHSHTDEPPVRKSSTKSRPTMQAVTRSAANQSRVSSEDSGIVYDTGGRLLHENRDEQNQEENDSGEGDSSTDSSSSVDDIPALIHEPLQPPQEAPATEKKLPVLRPDQYTPLSNSRSGRFYKVIELPNGQRQSTLGVPIPDGYRKYPDEATPWICPIRSCRKLLRNSLALGGHFSAGHRDLLLNDNGDGTFSVVATYRAGPGNTGSVVISHNEPDPNEPPMAIPRLPPNQRAIKGDLAKKTRKHRTRAVIPQRLPSRRVPSRRELPPKVTPIPVPTYSAFPEQGPGSARRGSTPSQVSRSLSSSKNFLANPNIDAPSDVREYLRSVMGPKFNLERMFRPDSEILYTLPRKRLLPYRWLRKWADAGISKAAFLGLVVYLVGDEAESPCFNCHGPEPFEACVVANDKFPPAMIDYLKGTCAVCHFKFMKLNEKNMCTHIQDPDDVQLTHDHDHDLTLGMQDEAKDSQWVDDSLEGPDICPGSMPILGAGPRARKQRDALADRRQPRGTTQLGGPTKLPRRFNDRTRWKQQAGAAHYDGNAVLLEPGQITSAAENLEMEDWELAPGRLEDNGTSEGVAFSTAYLTARDAIPVTPDVGFNVLILKPGQQNKWEAKDGVIRLCSMATGKLRVKMGDDGLEFQVGPNGMFKIRPGATVLVTNRLYVDAVVHVTTLREG